MSSAFAKKMLEKYGWKEGEGLGKDKQGVSTYVRAFRPKGEKGEYIGIGHEASKGTANSDMGYGKVLSDMHAASGKRNKQGRASSSSSADEGKQQGEESKSGDESNSVTTDKVNRVKRGEESSGAGKKEARGARAPKPARRDSSSSSSSSSSDGDGADHDGDVTSWNDAKLFERCGGVRLGRAGRHRFFDNKMARVAEHDQKTAGVNPYAESALPTIREIGGKKQHKGKKH
jgi:hypothetical protein